MRLFLYLLRFKSDDEDKKAIFWKRKDYPDVVYRTEEAKLRAIVLEILKYHIIGRPILVGTTSIEHSEKLSSPAANRFLAPIVNDDSDSGSLV